MKAVGTVWFTIFVAVCMLFIIGAAVFVVIQINKESRLRDAAMATQAQSSARDAYTGSLRLLARDTADSRAALNAITSERDVVALIELLEESGDVAGVEVSIDAVSSDDNNEDILQTVVVSMSASGPFEEVMHLLSIIESLPAVSSISQFEVERGAGETSEWHLQIRVRFLTENNF